MTSLTADQNTTNAQKCLPGPPNRLSALPTEILLLIASFLSKSSAALLTFCDKALYKKMGTKCLEAISAVVSSPVHLSRFQPKEATTFRISQCSPDESERLQFLHMLAKNYLPDSIYCYYCTRIHKPDKTRESGFLPLDKRLPCASADFSQVCRWVQGYNCDNTRSPYIPHVTIYFSDFQFAMQMHSQKKDCRSFLKSLTFSATWHHENFSTTRVIEPRLRGANFIFRKQNWVLIEKHKLTNFLEFVATKICLHQHAGTAKGDSTHLTPLDKKPLEDFLRCRISHYNDSIKDCCKFCSGLRKCHSCATEYQIDTRWMRRNKWAVVFTSWHDLGQAHNPFDPQWMHHFIGQGLPILSPLFELGSIKAAYEGSEYFEFDENLMTTPSLRKEVSWKERLSDRICYRRN